MKFRTRKKISKEIDESDSEDYVKEGLVLLFNLNWMPNKLNYQNLKELSDKIDELDAEIAKLKKTCEDFKNSSGVSKLNNTVLQLEEDLAAKPAELEKLTDLKKAVNEPGKTSSSLQKLQPQKHQLEQPKTSAGSSTSSRTKTREASWTTKPKKTDDQQAEEDYARRSEEEYNRLTQQQPPKAEKPAPAPQPRATSSCTKTGWKQENGMWYFYNTDGSMATGWLQNNGSWHYLTTAMVLWQQVGSQNSGSWYYLNANGAVATGMAPKQWIMVIPQQQWRYGDRMAPIQWMVLSKR